MNLRVRGPAGQATIAGVDGSTSVEAFLKLLGDETGVPPGQQEILHGFPPTRLQLPADTATAQLSSLPISNGETLTVRQSNGGSTAAPASATASAAATAALQPSSAAPAASYPGSSPAAATAAAQPAIGTKRPADAAPTPPREAAAAPAAGSSGCANGDAAQASAPGAAASQPLAAPGDAAPPQQTAAESNGANRGDSVWAEQQLDDDEALARAIAASMEGVDGAGAAGGSAAGTPSAAGPAPDSRQQADGSLVVRRVMDADNSCLFNAVGYVMEGDRTHANRLRALIARTVADDPETYTEAFLERPNDEYCAWILDDQKWGGAIELSILSKYYGREIAAYDIQTQRCDVYGSEEGYAERAMLLYDGLHYDALALAAWPDAPEHLDTRLFATSTPGMQAAAMGAAEVVALAHAARAFTDTAGFTLRCGVCQAGVKGEVEAREHARVTGHQNFQEYR